MEDAQKQANRPNIENGQRKKGRPPIEPFWEEKVFSAFANSPRESSASVYRRLQELEKAEGRPGAPSLRTIGRLREKFGGMSETDRSSYRFVTWPETFERGDLPWEAAPAVFGLLRNTLSSSEYRPTVRLAFWYWRLSQLEPQVSHIDLGAVAYFLVELETEAQKGSDVAELERARRSLELYLLGVKEDYELPPHSARTTAEARELADAFVAAIRARNFDKTRSETNGRVD